MIRLAYSPECQFSDRPEEDIDLTAPVQWDLATALDMCHRVDKLIRTRGQREDPA